MSLFCRQYGEQVSQRLQSRSPFLTGNFRSRYGGVDEGGVGLVLQVLGASKEAPDLVTVEGGPKDEKWKLLRKVGQLHPIPQLFNWRLSFYICKDA